MTQKIKILHVTDASADVNFLQNALAAARLVFDDAICFNNADFIRALKTSPPHIILFSQESLARARDMLQISKMFDQNIPFVLVVEGDACQHQAVDLVSSGADDYVMRDQILRLPIAVRNALEKYRIRSQWQKFLTENNSKEEMLKRAEALSHTGSWQANMRTGKHTWSEETFRIYGYKPNEIEPSYELFMQHIHPEDISNLRGDLEEAMEFKNSNKSEFRIIDTQGNIKYICSELIIERNEDGKPVFLTGFNQDVTDKKLAARKVFLSNERYELATKATDDVIWDWDIVNGKIYRSENYTKLFGYNAEISVDPAGWHERINSEDKERVEASLTRALNDSTQTVWEETYGFMRYDDESVDIADRGYIVRDVKGKATRMVGAMQNITNEKRAKKVLSASNEALSKSNEELDKFVYSVSHDLRAPLTSMLGVIEITKMETEDPLINEHLMLLTGSIKKLDGFIQDILDYSRNTRLELEQNEINFADLIADVSTNLKFMGMDNRRVDITCDVTADACFVSDKRRLSVIFNNLIANAIRYQNVNVTNPHIKIQVQCAHNATQILVSDNGIGIDQANIGKIFEMFYRVSSKSVGSGLGLYIVKDTIAKLKGSICVDSQPGVGTAFTIHLPDLRFIQ